MNEGLVIIIIVASLIVGVLWFVALIDVIIITSLLKKILKALKDTDAHLCYIANSVEQIQSSMATADDEEGEE